MPPLRVVLAVLVFSAIGAAPARADEAEPMYALVGGTQLVSFTTSSATATSSVALTGLGDDLIGSLDVRPATGELYGLAGSHQLYRIDTVTGAAAPIGAPLTFTGSDAELDFDPVADMIRIVTSGNENLRVDPVTGAQTSAAGLSSNTNPRGVAYTNAVAGATSSTAYELGGQTLSRLGGFGGTLPSADSGTLTAIGTHNKAVGAYGFDISPESGRAFFVTFNDSTSPCQTFAFCLERIDLSTAAATPVLSLGNLNGIAVAPRTSPIFLGSRLFAAREGDGNAVVTVRRSGDTRTAATATYTLAPGTAGASDFATAGGTVTFAPGETSKSVSIPITDDSVVEPAETFTITTAATTGTGAMDGSPTTATVEIFDNDVTPAATPTPTVVPDTTKPTVLAFGAPTAKLKAFLKGYKVTASCSEACTLTSTAKLGKTTVGTLTGTLSAAGIFKGTLKPSKAGGKALKKKLKAKKAKPAKLTITTVATDAVKLTATSKATVKVSR